MRETSTTRRRVVQGVGAIGVASVAGGTVVTAQDGGGDDRSAAIRVVHASPDAPNVDIRLDGGDGEEGGGDGDTETPEDGNGDGAAAEIDDLGFREVSSYSEVDPGTYRAQVVVSDDEGALEGILDEFFGDDEGDGEDGETVVFDEEVDVQEGTTYTAVAFGELSQGPASAEGGDDGGTPTETDEGLGEDDDGEQGTTGRGFQVEVLEDDVSDPGEDNSRVRIFHAVPDVDTVSIATADGGDGEDGGTGDDTETPEDGDGQGGETLVDELAYGESETVELAPGDYTLQIGEAGGTGTDDGTETESDGEDGGATDQQGGSDTREAELSTEGSTSYSGFALGYFDPGAAGDGGDGTETPEDDGTETPEDGEDGDGPIGDAGEEEFELVIVEDSQGGERSDGGTDGLL